MDETGKFEAIFDMSQGNMLTIAPSRQDRLDYLIELQQEADRLRSDNRQVALDYQPDPCTQHRRRRRLHPGPRGQDPLPRRGTQLMGCARQDGAARRR